MDDTHLDTAERARLIEIVADLYDFVEPRDRRVFIQESAGLGQFLPGLNLVGAPRTVAGDLVGRLERFGLLPDRQNYHALGALLGAMLELGDLAVDRKIFLATLIIHHSLILDVSYLNGLRE